MAAICGLAVLELVDYVFMSQNTVNYIVHFVAVLIIVVI